MRTYKAPSATCAICGLEVRPAAFGGWEHARRQRITDPAWHRPSVVFDIVGYLAR